MGMIEPILMELEQEAATTRRVLDRVPEDKLGWKPHAKSMTLGELAGHLAGACEQPTGPAENARRGGGGHAGESAPEMSRSIELRTTLK